MTSEEETSDRVTPGRESSDEAASARAASARAAFARAASDGEPSRRGGRHRTALEAVLRETSPQGAMHELLGDRQLWWKCCSEAARTDPSWLFSDHAEQLTAWIEATAPDGPSDRMSPALHTYLLARALSTPEDRTAEHDEELTRVRGVWASSGLLSAATAPGLALPSGQGLDHMGADTAERLNALLERLPRLPVDERERRPASDGMVVVAALLMAGCEPRGRPSVRVPVVFGETDRHDDDEEPGTTGVLELREFPAGPPGLYPDPRSMTGLRSSDGQFATALGRAWAAAGPGRGSRCVLWRLVFTDRPVPPTRIEGPSLGAAFALSLRELLRHPRTRRPSVAWLRGVFYGLRPRTAVTGALGHGERLIGVSGMESKLLAARRRGLRLVAPAANRPEAAHAPEPADVKFAETLRQADRYARRFRTARLFTALALLAAALTSGAVVEHRASAARERLDTAHRLADVSESLLRSDVGLAGLFAERAYRQHADPLTRRALFRAVTASPHWTASTRASGTISATAASGDGRHVLAGTRDGHVELWTLDGGRFGGHHRRLGRLGGAVETVAADTDGTTVVATDHRTVTVWADGKGVAAPVLPHGQPPTAIAVSPSGRFVAVTTTTSEYGLPRTLSVLDRVSGRTGRLVLDGMTSDPAGLAFDGDTELVTVEYGYGTWSRISVKRLTRTAGGTVGFGVHNSAAALASDGSYFTYSNKGSPLPVWPSRGKPQVDSPELGAETEPGAPTALAVSPGGTHVATAIGSTLRVSRTYTPGRKTYPPGRKPSRPLVLPGAGPVGPGTLAFVGSGGDRLVSAARDVLTLWDLEQRSRIARAVEVPITGSCLGCDAPRVSVSPDGRDVAVLDSEGTGLSTLRLGAAATERQRSLPAVLNLPGLAELLWRPDSERLFVVAPDGSAQILARERVWRTVGFWPAVPDPRGLADAPALLRFLPGGGTVAEVHTSGTVRFRDPESGKVLREVPGPRSMAPTTIPRRGPGRGHVALDARAEHAALIEWPALGEAGSPRIRVIDTKSGRVRTLDAADVRGIAYADDRLLVQRADGALETWTASGSRRTGRVEGTADLVVGPVVGGDLVAGTTSEDHTVRLLDLTSESTLGTLLLPEGNKSTSTGLAVTEDGTKLITATEADFSESDDPEPDGPTTDDMGQIIEWRMDPDAWIQAACSSAGTELRPDDWAQHMGTEPPPSLRCGG
ncbi:WD40 repeat domain-containing protein [Streptomyces sp. NPDC101490]|uniref:WD40 repeat domain-containing protein n=1 Tax=Streptomyces sp. NPDC101490 TaxID=3366143 RepID=UPI00380EB354